MKSYILAILFLLLFQYTNGQNKFFIGDKTYTCTERYTLITKRHCPDCDLDVLIAKDGENGMIVLSTKPEIYNDRIKGNIKIYLDDATVITCIDKGKYDFVDGISTAIYYLTKEEINKMKNSNISVMRFSLRYIDKYNNFNKEYTASNRRSYGTDYTHGGESYTTIADFPNLLVKLFGN